MGPIFAKRWRVISGLLRRTVETSTNLLRGVIGLISTRNDYPNTVLDDVLSLRGSCTYTVKPQLRVWTTKELTHTLVYICFSFPCRHIIWRFTQSSGITFILKSSFHVVLIGLWKSGITITCTCLYMSESVARICLYIDCQNLVTKESEQRVYWANK